MFSEIFSFKTLTLNLLKLALENRNLTDVVENSFLHMIDTFLKLPLQKIICAICRC